MEAAVIVEEDEDSMEDKDDPLPLVAAAAGVILLPVVVAGIELDTMGKEDGPAACEGVVSCLPMAMIPGETMLEVDDADTK